MTETATAQVDLSSVTDEQRNAIIAAETARTIDRAVRYARRQGYCSEVENALRTVFPEHVGRFYDSGGTDCQGNTRAQYEDAERRETERRRHRDAVRATPRCDVCGERHGALGEATVAA